MNALGRRRLVSGAIGCSALAALGTLTPPAQADLFGADVAVLTGILTQSISQAGSLTSMVLQIANELRMMTTMLHQVASGSFPALCGVHPKRAGHLQHAHLGRSVDDLSHGAASTPNTKSSSPREGRRRARRSRSTGRSTSRGTKRSSAPRRSRRASRRPCQRSIPRRLRPSRSSRSPNRPPASSRSFQLIAQMIGITNSELTLLNQTLATASRVLTDLAASSASERQLSLGKGDDVRSGYTDKGKPVTVPHSLP